MGFEVYPQHHTVTDEATGEKSFAPNGEYGWRRRGRDGEITATGHEGFTREEDAERAVREHLAAVYAEMFPTLNNPELGGQHAATNVNIRRVAE